MSDPLTTTIPTVSATAAQAVLAAASTTAAELDAPSTIVVVDAHGLLKAMIRMDGAPLIGVDLARQKAYTCVAMGGRDTAQLAQAIAGNAQVLAALTSLPDVAVLSGGAPLLVDEVLVGAVGVSAPSGGADIKIAEAAVASFGTR